MITATPDANETYPAQKRYSTFDRHFTKALFQLGHAVKENDARPAIGAIGIALLLYVVHIEDHGRFLRPAVFHPAVAARALHVGRESLLAAIRRCTESGWLVVQKLRSPGLGSLLGQNA